MRHYIWVLFEKLGVITLKIASVFLLARVLTPDDFGLYAMIAVVVTSATMLVDSGMGGSLIRKKNSTNIDYSTVFLFNTSTSILLYILAYTAAPYIADFYNQENLSPVIRVLSTVLIIRSLTIVHSAKLTSSLRFRTQSYIYIASAGISLGITYKLATQGFGYWALVSQQIIEALLIFFGLSFSSNYSPKINFSTKILREHFGFGSRLVLSSIIDVFANNSAMIAMGKSFGANTTGGYYQANKVNEILTELIATTIDKASLPQLAKIQDNEKAFTEYIEKLLSAANFFSFLLAAIIVPCSSLVIYILLGGQWNSAGTSLQVLALSGYGMACSIVARNALKTLGRSDIILRLSLIKAAFAIALIFTASLHSFDAILLAVVCASMFNSAIGSWVLKRMADIPYRKQISILIRPLACSIILMALLFIILPSIKTTSIYDLLLITITSTLFYVILSATLNIAEAQIIMNYLRKIMCKRRTTQ